MNRSFMACFVVLTAAICASLAFSTRASADSDGETEKMYRELEKLSEEIDRLAEKRDVLEEKQSLKEERECLIEELAYLRQELGEQAETISIPVATYSSHGPAGRYEMANATVAGKALILDTASGDAWVVDTTTAGKINYRQSDD